MPDRLRRRVGLQLQCHIAATDVCKYVTLVRGPRHWLNTTWKTAGRGFVEHTLDGRVIKLPAVILKRGAKQVEALRYPFNHALQYVAWSMRGKLKRRSNDIGK